MSFVSPEPLIDLCRRLIAIPSVMQEERELAAFAAERMEALGFTDVHLDEFGNVIGRVAGRGGGGRRLLLDAHIDTIGVPEPDKWRTDPFGGEVRDGRIYGRGAADMKGAFAAMLMAGAMLAGDRGALAGDLYVSGTVCEELVEGPALGHVLAEVNPDWVVIGESTGLNLAIGQRGRAELRLTAHGKPAHSSAPHLGVNAVEQMAVVMAELRGLQLAADPLLGQAILALTAIISSPYPGQSVLPDRCFATYDRRLLVGETPAGVLEEVRQAIAAAGKGLQARVDLAKADFLTYTGYHVERECFAPAWKTAPQDPLVQGALVGLRKAGLSPSLTAYAFCTNGSESAGRLGTPTIGFGPGSEAQAHTVDEYLELSQLTAAAAGYAGLVRSLLA